MKRKAFSDKGSGDESGADADYDAESEKCEELLRRLRNDDKIKETEYILMHDILLRNQTRGVRNQTKDSASLIDMIMAIPTPASAPTLASQHTTTSKLNLSPLQFPVTHKGIKYPTILHYLQARKVEFTDMDNTKQKEMCERIAIKGLQEATVIGRGLKIDVICWDNKKADIMMHAYLLAYDQQPYIAEALKNTTSVIIEDGLQDIFWGHTGENMAGKLWMDVKKIKNIEGIIRHERGSTDAEKASSRARFSIDERIAIVEKKNGKGCLDPHGNDVDDDL